MHIRVNGVRLFFDVEDAGRSRHAREADLLLLARSPCINNP
jgi:hypothetical protein